MPRVPNHPLSQVTEAQGLGSAHRSVEMDVDVGRARLQSTLLSCTPAITIQTKTTFFQTSSLLPARPEGKVRWPK